MADPTLKETYHTVCILKYAHVSIVVSVKADREVDRNVHEYFTGVDNLISCCVPTVFIDHVQLVLTIQK